MVAVLALAVGGLVGCSAGGPTAEAVVYASLALSGADAPYGQAFLDGAQLALDESAGRAGDVAVTIQAHDDAVNGHWDADRTRLNAEEAVADPRVVAYLGELNSGATAVSLPILNRAGIVSSGPSTAIGLTHADGTHPEMPAVFQPSGKPTFARLVPSDRYQASALVDYMTSEGSKRLFVVSDGELYGGGLAAAVEANSTQVGMKVVGTETITGAADQIPKVAQQVKSSGADTFFFGGVASNNASEMFQAVHNANPKVRLFGGDGVAGPEFVKALGAASASTYLTSPAVDYRGEPAKQLAAKFKQAHRGDAPQFAGKLMLARGVDARQFAYYYGYVTMQAFVAAIAQTAGAADSRAAVRDAVFGTDMSESAVGPWHFEATGDSTLSSFEALRVGDDGQIVPAADY